MKRKEAKGGVWAWLSLKRPSPRTAERYPYEADRERCSAFVFRSEDPPRR